MVQEIIQVKHIAPIPGGGGGGGERGISQKPHILKESVRLNFHFHGEGGVQTDKPSVGVVGFFQKRQGLL